METAYLKQLKQHIKADDTHWFYTSQKWLTCRSAVLKDHHGECYMCKQNNKLTQATVVHHVKHLRTHPQYALMPYVNGKIQLMPLCADCHYAVHHNNMSTKYPERW